MNPLPDEMPDEISAQKCEDLMRTIEGFCNESTLRRTEIIGALEGVKHSLLRAWFDEADDDRSDGMP